MPAAATSIAAMLPIHVQRRLESQLGCACGFCQGSLTVSQPGPMWTRVFTSAARSILPQPAMCTTRTVEVPVAPKHLRPSAAPA